MKCERLGQLDHRDPTSRKTRGDVEQRIPKSVQPDELQRCDMKLQDGRLVDASRRKVSKAESLEEGEEVRQRDKGATNVRAKTCHLGDEVWIERKGILLIVLGH